MEWINATVLLGGLAYTALIAALCLSMARAYSWESTTVVGQPGPRGYTGMMGPMGPMGLTGKQGPPGETKVILVEYGSEQYEKKNFQEEESNTKRVRFWS